MFGKETSEKRRLDVRALVGEVVALVQAELETHRVSLRNDITDRLLEVVGDRVQLQQVLLNLTMNAIEAMSSETGRDRHLTIASGVDENAMVRITVEDTGVESTPLTSTEYSIPSSRPNPREWGWAFRFADQSLKRMAASCGRYHEALSERCSI